jgi:hypothetical protein
MSLLRCEVCGGNQFACESVVDEDEDISGFMLLCCECTPVADDYADEDSN